MYYTIIAIALAALGFALLFFLDTLISPTTEQELLKTIRGQSMLIGATALAGAYYIYTLADSEYEYESENTVTSTPSDLPSYEDATSDILKL
jgi:hypothetical protein